MPRLGVVLVPWRAAWRWVLLAVLAITTTTVGHAQVGVPAAAQQDTSTMTMRIGTGALVTGGLLGAFGGMAFGVAIGNRIDRARRGEDRACAECTRWGAGIGASVGTTLGVALGVHLTNRFRGRLGTVLARTAAAMAPFWIASYVSHRVGAEGVDALSVVGGVVTGIFVAVRAEQRTTTSDAQTTAIRADYGMPRDTWSASPVFAPALVSRAAP